MDLARRSIRSVSWLAGANLAGLCIGLLRAVLLARWLPVQTFGTYALAGTVVGLTVILPNFGLLPAFLHRTDCTRDEDRAAAVHFTLVCGLSLLWFGLLGTAVLLFTQGDTGRAILILLAVTGVRQLTQTPRALLVRRVQQRRLAVIQFVEVILATATALALARQGLALGALLATDMVSAGVQVAGLYAWRPVWHPRIRWDAGLVRYFLTFGGRNLVGQLLVQGLNRIGQLWVGLTLGKTPLGFYSRAERFARFPGALLGGPLNAVMAGSTAEIAAERERLARLFWQTNALILRFGLLCAGGLALVGPEFVRVVLGAKWLPMVPAFRILLALMVLEPLTTSAVNLLMAVGQPATVVRARLIQLFVLALGIFWLGPWFGIAGVAASMLAMAAAGSICLMTAAGRYVPLRSARLWADALLALATGMGLAGILALVLPPLAGWLRAACLLAGFGAGYVGLLALLEGGEWRQWAALLRRKRLAPQSPRAL